METSTHRPDLHVVQQSRRDKLRFQNNIPSSSSSSYLGDYSGNSEHWSLHNKQQGPNMDLAQLPASCPRYGNVSYDPSVLSSEMLKFGSDSQSLAPHNKTDGVIVNQESSISPRDKRVMMNADNNSPFSTLSNHFGNCSAWKSVGDWNNVASYSNNNNIVVNPMAVGETSSSLIPNVKPSYTSSLVPGQYSSWLDNSRSELHLLPNYGDHNSGVLCVNNGDTDLVNRAVEGIHHEWHGEFERGSRNDISNTTQALSLSLSSVSPSKSQFGPVGDQHNSNNNVSGDFNGVPGLRSLRSDYLCSSLSKNWSKVLANSTLAHLNVVPFGPFTGYATILKSSRFLEPAQQLLDELCDFSGHSALTVSELTKKVLDEVILSNDAFDDNGATTFFGSNSSSLCSSNNESYPRPEFQQTRVKLLYMQDEICRRYKQYHQQMHMVVSSFESVAGLSAATPYILLALKTVARNFFSIKTAISDQLRNIRKTLGQELLSRAGGSKGDRVGSGLKLVDHPPLEKQRAMGGFLDPQPHIWRPQRGLPERAVAVLRAWLFDHFLHPYPTDADKHMLATQTGLTRNQVSNWFINARVRVWKPMVEEIHMLETKAMTERGGSNVGKPEVTIATEGLITQPNHSQHFNNFAFPNESQYSNRLSMRGIPGVQAECCSGIGSLPYIGERSHPGASWGPQEKQQLRINCHVPPVGMDGPMMGFMPYHHQNNIEIGGLGSVSLTLGLRQSAEGAQQQHEPQLRQQLGGQMMHDYFG